MQAAAASGSQLVDVEVVVVVVGRPFDGHVGWTIDGIGVTILRVPVRAPGGGGALPRARMPLSRGGGSDTGLLSFFATRIRARRSNGAVDAKGASTVASASASA